jgi:hypothetical protein
MLGQRTYARKFRRRGGGRRKFKNSNPQVCGARPGFEGTRKLCQTMVESPGRRDKYEEVTKNVCGLWSTALLAQGQIDAAQEKAGDHFRWLYEQRASNMVLDACRVLVKKKSTLGHLPYRMLMTGQELAEVQRLIGGRRFFVLEMMCGQGLPLVEATRCYYGGRASRQHQALFLGLLLEALYELAVHWGYAAPQRQPIT